MKNKKDDIKTGIITVHKNINYGANLQAFATCKFLNISGINASVIDYLPENQDKENHFWSLMALIIKNEPDKSLKRMIKVILSLILMAPSKVKRLYKFKKFRKNNMNLTKYCKNSYEISKLCLDTVICGSDQIWNADITQGINPIYYGDIPGVSKRISYAASLGSYKFSDKDVYTANKLIKNLTYCSVRESDTQTYINKLTGLNCEVVCDPVFLLDKSVYKDFIGKRFIKNDYVLVYSIISDNEMLDKAYQYAEQKGLTVVEICASKNRRKKHIQLDSLGPEEFLTAFYYAYTIFTNSFHGTAFSIIFEKNFYIFNNKHGGSRITNLLNLSNLQERLVDNNTDTTSLIQTIDYIAVNNSLKDYINHSKNFLIKSVKSHIESVSGDSCVGCGACSEICPKKAIKMIKNNKGFYNALITKELCINCDLCKKVCPALRNLDDLNSHKSVYAFKFNDDKRLESTSGGAFSAISEFILENSGTVYGAAFNNIFSVKHIKATNETELSSIRGVKYVQSDTTLCFESIAEDLKNDKTVLFTGTPCQVSAIKEYLELKKVNTDKLYLVDIICHGIPSPLMYENYIKYLEDKFKSKIKTFKFRNKNISWRGNSSSVLFENGTFLSGEKYSNGFMNLYYSNAITRESCYQCRYTSLERISDLTISDYWGIENKAPEFEDKLGVSMILVNTQKGESLLSNIKGNKIQTDIIGCKQPQLYHPTEKPKYFDVFWNEFYSKGFDFVLEKYAGFSNNRLINKVKSKIKSMLCK